MPLGFQFDQVEAFGKPECVHTNRMASDEFLKTVSPGSIGFCFLDTSHTYEQTRLELSLVLPGMQPGGILMVHDYAHPDYTGLKEAVDETFSIRDDASEAWHLLNAQTFIALQRKNGS